MGSEVLAREWIYLGRNSETMVEAIEFVGNRLVDRGVVRPGYLEGMRQRELTVSTFLGNGVAMPHGTFETRDEVLGTGIVIAQYPQGIDWGGETVHLAIGLAAIGEDHVQILSQLAEVLQDEETCQRLWVTTDPEEVLAVLFSESSEEDDGESAVSTIVIVNPTGLHARPATRIVDLAKKSQSEASIVKGGKTANAQSIMSVLALGAATGDTVTISAHGADAADLVDAICGILTSNEA